MNRVVVAAAGSGKTTWIVERVLAAPERRAVITTYTTANARSIREKFGKQAAAVPTGVQVLPWYSFLLRDTIRPYQNHRIEIRIPNINLVSGRSARYARKGTVEYFFDRMGRIYTDKMSQFALECNNQSKGKVLARIKRLYHDIYVDEIQDLAGYDLDLLEEMIKEGIKLTMVGDCRQSTYSTNLSGRHKKYRGERIVDLFREWEKKGLCELENQSHSYRCVQPICDVADLLFEGYEDTISKKETNAEHQGVFVVDPMDVQKYIALYAPQVLRHNRRSKCLGLPALNYGYSKGLEFPRVLVFPTGPIKKWLKSGARKHIEKAAPKLYVAITRAALSVAFVYQGTTEVAGIQQWNPTIT